MATTMPADPLLRHFSGRIEPVRLSAGYALALLAVAVLMVALPVAYVGLIAVVAKLWWWHLVNDAGVFSSARGSGGIKGAFLVYVGPLVIGAVLILFMLKPLLARPGKRAQPITLDPRREPRLFAFVSRLCESVGAPQPKRIDVTCEVNASASFRRGWLSFLGDDLVLTIGLHLVAGQSLRQFSGVLAHEFGHFSQGWAMRASYVIWSVNAWFARVVYQRDAFDEKLVELSNSDVHIAFNLVLWIARLMVWLTRRVLWVLMLIGHLCSTMLSRQMEFDADRHAARLVGREAFASALRELPVLCAAEQGAHADLGNAWRERRLADDLPALVAANLGQIKSDLRQRIIADGLAGSTGMYATHPATRDRIAAGEGEPERGVFAAEGPASQLFGDFAALCRRVTLDWYDGTAGLEVKPANLIPTARVVEAWEREQAAAKTVEALIGGLWTGATLFAPGDEAEPAGDPAALAKELARCEDALLDAQAAQALVSAGVKPDATAFKLTAPTSAAATSKRNEAANARARARVAAARAARAAMLRLQPADGPEAEGLRACLASLAACQEVADDIRSGFHVLQIMFANLEGRQQDETYVGQVRGQLTRQRSRLQRLRDAVKGRPYPFEHATAGITLDAFLVPALPSDQDPDAVMRGSQAALGALFGLHARCLGRLAVLAEAAGRPA